MLSYLSLVNFTDQGIRDVKDSVQRAAGFRSAVETAGGTVREVYWAIGEADGAVIFDAPDEETAVALLLSLAHNGFVRTRTMRVFGAEEFEKVLAKV